MTTADSRAASPSPELRVDHLQAAADACSEGMIWLDGHGRALAWNRAAARILAPALAISQGVVVADAFETGAAFQGLLARGLAGERITNERLDIDGSDGRGGPVVLTLIPLLDGDAATVGCTAVLQDVSEQVASQQALAEGERRVRRAEGLGKSGTFVIDAESGAEQWSDGMYQIHGVDPADFIATQQNHLALIAEDDRSLVATLFSQTLAGTALPAIDHRIDRGDGTRSWVSVAVEPRRGVDGRVLGLDGVCQDITARVETEAAVQRALMQEQAVSEELRKLDSLKDEFLATVSHELRTPLTAIAGYAELLQGVSPESTKLIDPIIRNAHDIQEMAEWLLHEARLEAGRISVEPIRLELGTAVRKLLTDQPELLGTSQVVIDIDDGLAIDMDQRAFVLVVSNLVSNAAKYAPGGPITISAAQTPTHMVVSVADEGEGVPREYVERIFERFFRIPGADGVAGGSGFGLSIVRRYVELHDGTVSCESSKGRGARFSFRIPITQP